MSEPTPARKLLGLTLDGGWRVVELVEESDEATGSRFSTGYIVESRTGHRGFLKALDYSEALKSGDPARALQALTAAYIYERDLLHNCRDRGFDRVVVALDDGTVRLGEGAGDVVQYLIFEVADGDLRSQVDLSKRFDAAWLLRSLHHVATGMLQLHSALIAHQDLKPSNVLVFAGGISKIADLGSAAFRDRIAPHDGDDIPGDPMYAPPEQLYKYSEPDWIQRRLGGDLYLLGSMIVFCFSGSCMTAFLFSRLQDMHRWYRWGGTFEDVLPYLRDASDQANSWLRSVYPNGACDDLEMMVRQLCDPDPRLRGHPALRGLKSGRFSLERFVSKLNLLASRAEIGILDRNR